MTTSTAFPAPLTAWQRMCRSLLLRALESLAEGQLTVRDAEGVRTLGRRSEHDPLQAELTVLDGRFYAAALLDQSAGVGRAYMEGWWRCDDTLAMVRILARNEAALRRWTGPSRSLLAPWHRFQLWRRRNHRRGARRNIAAHYDTGNEFFSTFLDPTLTYSSAVFEAPDQELQTAQTAKLDRICRKLDLQPHHHVLEIGTGWGSFAVHAATNYGCRVTTTLSAEQARHARALVSRRGLGDRVTVVEQDYRDLTGQYDRLVSIEMIEAVGVAHYDTYFRRCSELLRPDGAMALQAIVVDDRHFVHDARHQDYIKRYIFPGGVLPSVAVIADKVARQTDLRTAHLEDLGAHYAETLRRWREALLEAGPRLVAAGRREAFVRAWDFYFLYCEGGFRERRVSVIQQTMAKPACRDLPLLAQVTTAWPEPERRAAACRA